MTYEEMADFIDELYDCQDVSEYTTFTEFANRVKLDFNGVSLDVAKELSRDKWDSCQELFSEMEKEAELVLEREREKEKPKPKPKEKPKEVKLTENQKKDIKNNDRNEDLTKREKTIETLEIANQEITVKQFYELNPNMLKPTARRELSTAVKRGELERVRKGVYRKL